MKQDETLERNPKQESLEDVNRTLRERIAELEQSEERLHRIIDTAGDGIYILDLKLNYKWVNEAMERLLGHSRDEIIGRSVSEFRSISWSVLRLPLDSF